MAEPLYGESFQEFSKLVKELEVLIIVSFFEKRMVSVYHNSAYIIDSDDSTTDLDYQEYIRQT